MRDPSRTLSAARTGQAIASELQHRYLDRGLERERYEPELTARALVAEPNLARPSNWVCGFDREQRRLEQPKPGRVELDAAHELDAASDQPRQRGHCHLLVSGQRAAR